MSALKQQWEKAGAVLRALAVPLTAIFLFFTAFVLGGFLYWFLFYAYIPFVFYHFLLFSIPFHTLKIDCSTADHCLSAGDTIRLTVHLKRRLIFPLFFVTVRPHADVPMAETLTYKNGIAFWLTREAVIPIHIPKVPRGKYDFNELVLEAGDLFGVMRRSVRLPIKTNIYVYPQARLLDSSELFLFWDRVHSPMRETDPYVFSGVRAYRPGDRPSRLDWKSTARARGLMTKQFDPEREQRASVLLVFRHDEPDARFEQAISFAASLVRTLLVSGYRLSLTYRKSTPPLLLHTRAAEHLQTVLRALAALKKAEVPEYSDVCPATERTDAICLITTDWHCAAQMHRDAEKSRQRYLVFLIADRESARQAARLQGTYFMLHIVPERESR